MKTVEEMFWEKINKKGQDDCWNWMAGNDGRYGIFNVHRIKVKAHRMMWMLVNGPIPEGKVICHKCDNPSCCNPNHLFLGTESENRRDMFRKGRQGDYRSLGEKNGRAKLTYTKVDEIRKLRKEGWTLQKLADRFGVSNQVIHKIVSNRAWKEQT